MSAISVGCLFVKPRFDVYRVISQQIHITLRKAAEVELGDLVLVAVQTLLAQSEVESG